MIRDSTPSIKFHPTLANNEKNVLLLEERDDSFIEKGLLQ
jgi:hypothetical protein